MNKSIWLALLLSRSHNGLTLADIRSAWADEDPAGRPMARSTFYDNCRYLSDRYGLCLRREDGRYRLLLPDGEAPGLFQSLFGGEEPDRHTARDAATAAVLAEAIHECREVRMEYHSLSHPPYTTTLRPYCLREAAARGYVVGHSSHHGEVRTFAIDRILTLTTLAARFTRPPSFSAEGWFAHSVGAFGGAHLRPERVVIEPLTAHITSLLRSRPLHASQHEESAEGAVRFVMEVAVTPDFFGQLLSFGAEVRIAAPATLRRRLQHEVQRMAEVYKDAAKEEDRP